MASTSAPLPGLLLLSLLLLMTAPARVGAQDWLRDLSAGLEALDERLEAPEAPPIRATDLFGERFELESLRGRVVVLSFLDRNSVDEAVTWLQRQTTWLLHQEGVSFVNVFYPGGISFLIPRGEVVVRIRERVRSAEQELSADLDEADRAFLEAADIRWVVDWQRHIAGRYPVERGRVNVFLLDQEGRIREVHRYDPSRPRAGLRRGVEALLASWRGDAAPGEDL